MWHNKTANQLNMLKKSFLFLRGTIPFFGFLHMGLIKMQIPLVESGLALLYSSWFSDLRFAFFVCRLRSGHFLTLWRHDYEKDIGIAAEWNEININQDIANKCFIMFTFIPKPSLLLLGSIGIMWMGFRLLVLIYNY